MGDFVVRIPLLENLGGQYGDLFAHSRRRLTQPEKAIAQPIFQSSVDLDEVQIVETGVINAPTTLGNHIRVSPGYSMDDATLIHELTHIWQFQTQGNGYISNSLYHQACCYAVRWHAQCGLQRYHCSRPVILQVCRRASGSDCRNLFCRQKQTP